jgi:hypothetical protein
MDPIPTITVPIGAANLHQVLNWLIDQINTQFANLDSPAPLAPEAFSLTVSVGPKGSAPAPPPPPEQKPPPPPKRAA